MFGSKEGRALIIEPKDDHIFDVHSSISPARIKWDVAQDMTVKGERVAVGTVHASIRKEGLERTYLISPLVQDRSKRMRALMTASTGRNERGTPLIGIDNMPKAIGGIAINMAHTTVEQELLRLHALWLEVNNVVPPVALQSRVIKIYEAIIGAFPPDMP